MFERANIHERMAKQNSLEANVPLHPKIGVRKTERMLSFGGAPRLPDVPKGAAI
jgi:hypothetical protein